MHIYILVYKYLTRSPFYLPPFLKMAAINCSDFYYMTCILNKIFQNSFYLNVNFIGKQNKVDHC